MILTLHYGQESPVDRARSVPKEIKQAQASNLHLEPVKFEKYALQMQSEVFSCCGAHKLEAAIVLSFWALSEKALRSLYSRLSQRGRDSLSHAGFSMLEGKGEARIDVQKGRDPFCFLAVCLLILLQQFLSHCKHLLNVQIVWKAFSHVF